MKLFNVFYSSTTALRSKNVKPDTLSLIPSFKRILFKAAASLFSRQKVIFQIKNRKVKRWCSMNEGDQVPNISAECNIKS